MASSKSTRWPSKSGPSTQANLVSPPTVSRQPPHMPVPSIMMGFMLTMVLMPYSLVSLHTNFIMIKGPMAMTWSYCWPLSMRALRASVTRPLVTPGAVVAHLLHQGAGLVEFLLQDHQVLGAEADDGMDLAALFVELLGHRVRDGAAHAAAHHGHLLEALGMGGGAQGAHEIRQGFPGLLVGQLDGGAAHQLVDDGDVALFPVIIGHGQGGCARPLRPPAG